MMEFFDFKEICEKADCLAIAKTLGMDETKPGRFNVPWRAGSDSGALAVNRDGWYDHVKSEGGSVIEMVSRTKFNGDIQQAQQWLGQHLNLGAKKKTVQKAKLVKAYAYRDLDGNDIHYTLRYEPKSFRQARPDPSPFGEPYIFDLEGVTPILYRMADWHTKKYVCVVEGEKDADTLCDIGVPATTCAQGAKAWRSDYNEHFRGKAVIILPDNDEPGAEHAEIVANNLHGIASEIRLITLSKYHKGDVTNWIEKEGGSKEKLIELAEKATIWKPSVDQGNPAAVVEAAKKANETPLANYTEAWEEDAKGKEKLVKRPRRASDLLLDLRKRLLGAPYRIGGTLFDRDRDTKEIQYIDKPADLFAWIARKTGWVPDWSNLQGMMNKQEFFSAVHAEAKVYQSISHVIDYPPRADVYYMADDLPEPHEKRQFLLNLIDQFGPETPADRDAIIVLYCAAMYWEWAMPRPSWVIDSNDGQGAGKTTIPEVLSALYGGNTDAGEVIMMPYRSIERGTEELIKRLLSATGRQRRIMLIDNIQGPFDSPELAEMITARSISGKAPYGKGEESRPNNITFVMTMNTATLGPDISKRSMFINIRKRRYDPAWKKRLYSYINEYRLNIIADIKGILESEAQYDLPTCTRFPEFEACVIQKAIPDPEHYSRLMKVQAERRAESDYDRDESSVAQSVIAEELTRTGINPDNDKVFIRSEVMAIWMRQVWPDYGTNRISQSLRNFAKNKLIVEILDNPKIYPHHGNSRRKGFMWRGQNHVDSEACAPRIIGVGASGEIKMVRS